MIEEMLKSDPIVLALTAIVTLTNVLATVITLVKFRRAKSDKDSFTLDLQAFIDRRAEHKAKNATTPILLKLGQHDGAIEELEAETSKLMMKYAEDAVTSIHIERRLKLVEDQIAELRNEERDRDRNNEEWKQHLSADLQFIKGKLSANGF